MERPWWHYVVAGLALVIGILALSGIAYEVPAFFDPCHAWGQDGDVQGGGTSVVSPGDGGCQGVTGTSETRGEAALRLLLVQGVTVGASALAVWGVWRIRVRGLAAAAVLMAGETAVLFLGLSVSFLVAAVAAVAYGLAAWRMARGPASPATGASREGRRDG